MSLPLRRIDLAYDPQEGVWRAQTDSLAIRPDEKSSHESLTACLMHLAFKVQRSLDQDLGLPLTTEVDGQFKTFQFDKPIAPPFTLVTDQAPAYPRVEKVRTRTWERVQRYCRWYEWR